jgi:hypothetical protein
MKKFSSGCLTKLDLKIIAIIGVIYCLFFLFPLFPKAYCVFKERAVENENDTVSIMPHATQKQQVDID